MKENKNSKKQHNITPTDSKDSSAGFDLISFLKNKDNLILIISSLALVITAIALVVVLVGRNSQGTKPGDNSGGNVGGGSGDTPGGDEDDPLRNEIDLSKVSYKNMSFTYFDTVSTIIGFEKTQDEFAEVSNEAMNLLAEYHKLFDIYNEYEGINNICTINKVVDGEHPVVKVDRKIIDMLLYAKEMYELTDGKMNIAMGSVLSIWHDYRTEGIDNPGKAKLPPMADLEAAAQHTDINNLIIDEENSTVWLADPEMKLDVGAFAKGYAVEMVARMLEEKREYNYVVNVGGNIRTTGQRADGKKWKTGIENPTGDPYVPYLEYIGLNGQAIVSSGSYQRYYIVNGKTYHHIIDSETLMPARGLLMVSIICEDSALGDGLSTALFCMSVEDGMALVNSLDGVEAMWVTEDEVKHYSDNFKNYLYK